MSLFDSLNRKRDEIGAKLAKKEFSFPADLVTGVVMLIAGAVVFHLAQTGIEINESDPVNGREFPELIMLLMMFCSAILIVKELIRVLRGRPLEMKTVNLLVEVRAAVIFCIFLGTYAIAALTDLFILGALFCTAAFLIYFRTEKRSYWILTPALTVLIWGAFRFGLGVDF